MDTTDAVQVQEAFADLLCADPDLTRAEFDAIIEANWGSAGPPPPPTDDIDPAQESPSGALVQPGTPESTRREHVVPPRTGALARLRSPPEPPHPFRIFT